MSRIDAPLWILISTCILVSLVSSQEVTDISKPLKSLATKIGSRPNSTKLRKPKSRRSSIYDETDIKDVKKGKHITYI
ncbi:hypothetical protein KSF78_0000737 [Schistosoma japonicum]|nr:hypothetical protein KSF78_0000737 [Schistosoma japonicum]